MAMGVVEGKVGDGARRLMQASTLVSASHATVSTLGGYNTRLERKTPGVVSSLAVAQVLTLIIEVCTSPWVNFSTAPSHSQYFWSRVRANKAEFPNGPLLDELHRRFVCKCSNDSYSWSRYLCEWKFC